MRIRKYKVVSSTNALAKKAKAEPWLIVCAEQQTDGYGKAQRNWYSPKGGLYFSVVLPQSSIEDLQTLTILAAFVVAKVLKENFDLQPLIKLPNDIYIGKKKVGGILTETIIVSNVKSSIIGIGINTNIVKFPKDLEKTASSLKIELGRKVNNEKILKQIINGLKQQLKSHEKQ